MNGSPTPAKVQLIEGSMRCFVLGLVSLIPIIGLPLGAVVLALNFRLRSRHREVWNPAERYLKWGCICASWGAMLSSLAAIFIGLFAAISSEK
jgi:hypothetical protein